MNVLPVLARDDDMYILQIWHENRWCWGIRDYSTKALAEIRALELKIIGIKARVKPAAEFYE